MNLDQSSKSKAWWQPALEVFAQISGWIIFPVVVALFLGDWLDNRYGAGSRYTLILVAVAFVITNIGLVKTTLTATRKMESLSKSKKSDEGKDIK